MRIVQNKNDTDFQIKIGNQYVTVASLVPWILSKHSHVYSLYFYYYGEEFEKGILNVPVLIRIWRFIWAAEILAAALTASAFSRAPSVPAKRAIRC